MTWLHVSMNQRRCTLNVGPAVARRPGRFAVRLGVMLAVITASLSVPRAGMAQCPTGWLAGGSGVKGGINAIAVLPNRDVIVGGYFTAVGGIATTNIARYSPMTNTWSALGAGTPHQPPLVGVRCVAALPDGGLIVGGRYDNSGAPAASAIAKYDPVGGWSALGGGGVNEHDGFVFAIAVLPGGDVIVGGQFNTPGGIAARNIARYSPATQVWSALGAGTNGQVSALAVLPDGDVIVGGQFSTANGLQANNVARYTPSRNTWLPMTPGVNRGVTAVAVLPNGDVIVGGGFDTAGTRPVTNIARYSPVDRSWSALGAGTTGPVSSLAVLPSGELVVGGLFYDAGNVLFGVHNVARYSADFDAWTAMGLGTDGQVSALAVLPDGEVVAGGGFTRAGQTAAAGFARWTNRPVCPADFNCSGTVTGQDLFEFLAGWFNGEYPAADFNGDGRVNVTDVFGFVAAWFEKCD